MQYKALKKSIQSKLKKESNYNSTKENHRRNLNNLRVGRLSKNDKCRSYKRKK